MNDSRPIRAKSGTNHEGTSAHNRRVMIDALRINGELSRADLARATWLTKQTVSNIIEPAVLGQRNVTVTISWMGSLKSDSTVKRARSLTINRVVAPE